MRAARFEGSPGVRAVETLVPEIGPGEALVRVNRVGICGSDLHITSGKNPRVKAPVIPGHEIVGQIAELAETGETPFHFQTGDRVAIFPVDSCMRCPSCLAGEYQLCRSLRIIGAQRDGGYAEYVAVPVRNLVPLPEDLAWDRAVLVEPLAVAVHAVRMSRPETGDAAVVIGAGPIGMLVAQVARHTGCSPLIMSEVSKTRIELAGTLGFECLDGSAPDFVERVLARTEDQGAERVFECVGHPATLEHIIRIGRTRARIVIVGVFKEPAPLDLFALSKKEQNLTATWMYSFDDFKRAVRLLSEEAVHTDGLVSHVLPLKDAQHGLDLVRGAAGSMKVVLKIED